MTIETAIVNSTTPTTTTTKSFESTGFGTPQAALILLSRTDTTNPKPDAGLATGYTDGTNSYSNSIGAEDNKNPTECGMSQANSDCIVLGEYDGTNSYLIVGAFDSWATDGITIDFTTVQGTAYNISVMLIKGCDNVKAFAQQLTSTGVNANTSIGFKANTVLVSNVSVTTIGHTSDNVKFSFGAAHNNSSDVVTQGMHTWASKDGVTPSGLNATVRNDAAVGRVQLGSVQWKGVFQDFDASGFDIDTDTDSPSSSWVFGLAIDTGNTDGVSIDIIDSPITTGNWSNTDPGFVPNTLILCCGAVATVNTIEADDDAGVFGIGMSSGVSDCFVGLTEDDDTATSNNQSNFNSAHILDLKKWSGSSFATFAKGYVDSFDTNGFTVYMESPVDGTTRRWLSIAFKDGTITGAVSMEIPMPSISLNAGITSIVTPSNSNKTNKMKLKIRINPSMGM